MKKLLAILVVATPFFFYSQDSLKQYKNTIGVEAFGETGGRYNITYSRLLYTTKNKLKFDGYLTLLPIAISRGYCISVGATKTISRHNYRISLGLGRGSTPFEWSYFSIPGDVRDDSNLIATSFVPQSFYFSNLGLKYKYQIADRINLFCGAILFYYPRLSESFVNKKEAFFIASSIGVEFKF